MKILNCFLILVLIANVSFSQSCDCKADLDFLVEKMTEMPSFKRQIKGDQQIEFDKKYAQLSIKMEAPIDVIKCYQLLQEQMMLVNDIHANISFSYDLGVYQGEDSEESIEAIQNSEAFIKSPVYNGDLVSLRQDLETMTTDTLEGIYSIGELMVVGIQQKSVGSYEVIILESNTPYWIPGQVKAYIHHNDGEKYDILEFALKSRKPRMLKSVSYVNNRIWSYKRVGDDGNYDVITPDNKWEFKQLNDSVQYVYFGSFGNAESNVKAFKKFRKETAGKFDAEHIIVDLRSNTGGNSKYSDIFIKDFRKAGAKVYVLTNAFTGSNGEQFTQKLIEKLDAIHLGQTTRGIIAYGMNYGYQYDFPSGNFQLTPTDMDFHKQYYQYEGKGIRPVKELSGDRDWIEQTLELIEEKEGRF